MGKTDSGEKMASLQACMPKKRDEFPENVQDVESLIFEISSIITPYARVNHLCTYSMDRVNEHKNEIERSLDKLRKADKKPEVLKAYKYNSRLADVTVALHRLCHTLYFGCEKKEIRRSYADIIIKDTERNVFIKFEKDSKSKDSGDKKVRLKFILPEEYPQRKKHIEKTIFEIADIIPLLVSSILLAPQDMEQVCCCLEEVYKVYDKLNRDKEARKEAVSRISRDQAEEPPGPVGPSSFFKTRVQDSLGRMRKHIAEGAELSRY